MALSCAALHAAAMLLLAATAAGPARAASRGYGPDHLPPVADGEDPLVDAASVVPGLLVQLAYARPENVTKKSLYPADARCRLRRSVTERLALAARALARQNLR
ncbi:MAG TPA: hypothetical protein VN874_07165, partial [Myxococcales bacterium]|nr:hypothetical protein [Myxococcales bacterium]